MYRAFHCLLAVVGLTGFAILVSEAFKRLPELLSQRPMLDSASSSYVLFYAFAVFAGLALLGPAFKVLFLLLRDLKLALQWMIYVGVSVESSYFDEEDIT